MGNILSSGPVQLPVDPSKLTTKELLNGGRAIPKPTVKPSVTPPKGMFGGRMAGILPGVQQWATRAASSPFGRAVSKGGAFFFGRDDGSANFLLGAMETANTLDSLGIKTDELLFGKKPVVEPKVPPKVPPKVTEKPTQEELEAIYHHPELKGPTNNEVGVDYDSATPGTQGSGAPGAVTGDNPFAIWAKHHKGLAEKVKPGQAGYEEIQKALGKTPSGVPASAYEGGTKLTDGEFEAPQLKSDPKIDFDSGFNVSQKTPRTLLLVQFQL